MIYNMHVCIYNYEDKIRNKLAATRNEPSPNWPYFKCELITAAVIVNDPDIFELCNTEKSEPHVLS